MPLEFEEPGVRKVGARSRKPCATRDEYVSGSLEASSVRASQDVFDRVTLGPSRVRSQLLDMMSDA